MRMTPIALLLACAACGAPSHEQESAAAAPSNAPASNESAPAPPPASERDNRAGGADACGASKLNWLLGKPRSAIPADAAARARIACATCPVTDDLRPDRLNIVFDEKTGLITKLGCY